MPFWLLIFNIPMEDVNSWLTWSFCLAALAAAVLAAKDPELRAITNLN